MLQEYLDIFYTAYLDNILIYSKNNKKHTSQVLKVLKQLREKSLQLNIDNCEFSVTEVKYLSLIVTIKEIRIDPKKVQVIIDWELLILVKDVQAFLGFARFYQQFIAAFSKKTVSLMEMTKRMHITTKSGKNKVKYNPFEWIEDCKKTFQDLKQAFITAPVLVHFDPELEMWIENNSSNFVTVSVFSQVHNRELKPVVYFSKKLTLIECNYMIYDKKLLAIVRSFAI